jgi:hypothetical protein
MWLRLLGIGLVVLGLLLLGPISTRGPVFGPDLRARRGEQEPWTYRVWFVRLVGALCVVGGIIYMVHPPHRFG